MVWVGRQRCFWEVPKHQTRFSLHLDLFFAAQECTYGIGLWPAKSLDVQQYSVFQVEKQNESAGDGKSEVPPSGDHFLHLSLQELLQPLFTLRIFPLPRVSSLHLPLMKTSLFWYFGENICILTKCIFPGKAELLGTQILWLCTLIMEFGTCNQNLKGAMLSGIYIQVFPFKYIITNQSQFYFRPGLFNWYYVNKCCINSFSAKQVPSQSNKANPILSSLFLFI